jgi:hypothetical protein
MGVILIAPREPVWLIIGFLLRNDLVPIGSLVISSRSPAGLNGQLENRALKALKGYIESDPSHFRKNRRSEIMISYSL